MIDDISRYIHIAFFILFALLGLYVYFIARFYRSKAGRGPYPSTFLFSGVILILSQLQQVFHLWTWNAWWSIGLTAIGGGVWLAGVLFLYSSMMSASES